MVCFTDLLWLNCTICTCYCSEQTQAVTCTVTHSKPQFCIIFFCQAALYHHLKDKNLLTTKRFGFVLKINEIRLCSSLFPNLLALGCPALHTPSHPCHPCSGPEASPTSEHRIRVRTADKLQRVKPVSPH